MSSYEYRERTVTFDPDGKVEFYMSFQRDFNALQTRLKAAGVTPLVVEELEPGYRVVVAESDCYGFAQIPRRKRPGRPGAQFGRSNPTQGEQEGGSDG